jgi:hypothetical protein
MHASGASVGRAERVGQVADGTDPTLRRYAEYVPVGDAVDTLGRWQAQGATIEYLSSHRNARHALADQQVLQRFEFPPGRLWFRQPGQTYVDVVETAAPDILIEDDCESLRLRARAEMITPHLSDRMRLRIICIVVPEFGGIDHLPANVRQLASGRPRPRLPADR